MWFPLDNAIFIAPDIQYSPNIGTHKKEEEGDLLFIVVLYPIRHYTHAIPIKTTATAIVATVTAEREEKVQWYYYHLYLYRSDRTIYYSYIIHHIQYTILITTLSGIVGTLLSVQT